MRIWLHQVLIALDQLINAIHGGWADETISSRAWRNRHRWPFKAYRFLIDLLFFWQCGHCKQAYESERLRLQAPPELRKP
jgi:hypothetical protein